MSTDYTSYVNQSLIKLLFFKWEKNVEKECPESIFQLKTLFLPYWSIVRFRRWSFSFGCFLLRPDFRSVRQQPFLRQLHLKQCLESADQGRHGRSTMISFLNTWQISPFAISQQLDVNIMEQAPHSFIWFRSKASVILRLGKAMEHRFYGPMKSEQCLLMVFWWERLKKHVLQQ